MKHTTHTFLGYRFGMLARFNLLFLNEHLKPLGLSAGQVSCLATLRHSNVPMTQDEILSSLAIDPATTARTVGLLVKKEHAGRTVNPENRRQKLVTATPKARNMEKTFFDILSTVENKFKTELTDEEQQNVLTLMDRMIDSARKGKHEQQQ